MTIKLIPSLSILICGILMNFSISAQCPPGDLNILDQEDVDAFAAEYPNCTELNGMLRISPQNFAQFTSLEVFQNIISINDDFIVKRYLSIIDSFSNLQSVGGDMEFSNFDGTSEEEILMIPAALNYLGGHLKILQSDSIIVAGMAGISMMSGDLIISDESHHIEFNALSNLESLNRIYIGTSSDIHFINGLALVETISEINIGSNSTGFLNFSGLENLQTIESKFNIYGCDEGELTILYLQCENYVNEVIIDYNDALISFTNCSLGSEIGSVEVIGSGVTDVHFLDGLEELNGDIRLINVPELQSSIPLNNLTHIDGDFRINNAPNLLELDGLSNIQEIDGDLSLSGLGITDQFFSWGFENLIAVEGSIFVSEMPDLTSLSAIGFDQLTQVGGDFSIQNTGIGGIDNMQSLIGIGGTLWLNNNPQMQFCGIPFICDSPGQVAFVANNGVEGFGCQNISQIDCFDSGVVSGQVFADLNCNGVFDPEDVGIPTQALLNDGSLMGFSNANGSYSIDLSFGEYENFTVAPLFGYENQDSYSFSGNGSFYTYDFGMCPLEGDVSNLSTSITPLNDPMPGFTHEIEVCVGNLGTQITSGSLTFSIPSFNEATIVDAEDGLIDGNTVSWTTNDLEPFESECFLVTVQIEPGTLGQVFSSISTVDMLGNTDDDISNNSYSFEQAIIGSFDPNDKLVDQELIDISNYENDSLFTLEYLIRFQNTGTAPAQFVRVIDEMPPELDPSTLEMIHASHNYELSYEPPGTLFDTPPKLEWFFDDINLPDSTTNEPESHGFIHFRISTYPDIEPGDEIDNFASIFFDYNEAVITEDAVTKFVECDEESMVIDAPTEVCAGDTVLLTAALSGFDTYTWTVEGEETTGGQQLQTAFNEIGDVQLTITNETCTLSTSLEIEVKEQPSVSLILGPYLTCDSTIEIDVMANGTVNWFLGDSLVATGDPVTLSQSGGYALTNENSCGILESGAEVIVHDLSLEVPENVCSGTPIALNPTSEGYNTFNWLIEGEEYTGDSLEVPFTDDGSIQIIAGSDYCIDDTLNLTIEVMPQPSLNIVPEPYVGCNGLAEINLDAEGMVNWFLNDELTATGDPVVLESSGLYEVVVFNQCDTIDQSIGVEVYDIPDEVTLNIDGGQLSVTPEGSDYVWFLNGLPISGLDGPSITPTENGEYSVIVYFENSPCSQTSNIVDVTFVSLNDQLARQIKIHPNPTRDFATIQLPQGEWTISLLNSKGQVLQVHERVTNTLYNLDLQELSPAVYFVRVEAETRIAIKKLVVK